MTETMRNKLLLTAGIFVGTNGALLALTPGRFVALRQMAWMPDRVNAGFEALARRTRVGRAAGLTAAAVGLAMLLFAVRQTEPVGAA